MPGPVSVVDRVACAVEGHVMRARSVRLTEWSGVCLVCEKLLSEIRDGREALRLLDDDEEDIRVTGEFWEGISDGVPGWKPVP